MSGATVLLATLLMPALLLAFVGSAWLYGYTNPRRCRIVTMDDEPGAPSNRLPGRSVWR